MEILVDHKKQLVKVDDRAARGGGVSAPVDVGFMTRVVQGISYVISGVTPSTWFGPSQPILPLAQEVKGRAFDYPVGYNLQIQKRPYEGVSFEQMRMLAENYDIMRLVIEARKDQIARMEWAIKPRKERGQPAWEREKAGTNGLKGTIDKVTEFFAYPDGENNWDQWLRIILEDMFVIDAATVYPRKTKGGQPFAFEILDGATIQRKINADGRTPEPPDVAYHQILKGVPAVDFQRDEIVYFPRNKRSWKVYGYSPVEQTIRIVNIALRRMLFQLAYFTEGNVPEALVGVPDEWTTDQIAQFQMYWDSLMEGNLAMRRHAKFVPGEVSKNVHETKSPPLKDDFDEWLARVVCYAFSVSPQPFVRVMNRATAESAAQMAQEEGLEPLLRWSKNLVDLLIWKYMGEAKVEFEWLEEEETDPLQQAQVDQIHIRNAIESIDEVRDRLGKPPLGVPAVFIAGNEVELADNLINPPEPAPIQPNPPEPGPGGIIAAEKLAKSKKKLRTSTAAARWYGQHSHG
jgi:hypothetical protein